MNNSTTQCASCGVAVFDGASFCQNCGHPIDATRVDYPSEQNSPQCISCGTTISVDGDFCQDCDTAANATLLPNRENSPKQDISQEQDVKKGESVLPASVTVYVEPPVAFASGLPVWNIEPPAVVIRRKAKI